MSIETFADLHAWFHERLDAALARRQVAAAEPTRAYLVDLLSRKGAEPGALGTPLALQLAEARSEAHASERLRLFRGLGDDALYLRGFWSEHLERRGITPDYVERLGGTAYEHAGDLASRSPEAHGGWVFRELARNFGRLADALDELRESTALRTPGDVVRLYDRWMRTHSPRLAERLSEEGVYPAMPKPGLVH